jgi:hypothetical protein
VLVVVEAVEVGVLLLIDKLDKLQCCYRYIVLNILNH